MTQWDSFIKFLDEANQLTNDVSRQQLVNELLRERPHWPWIEGRLATFIYVNPGAEHVALNLDIIQNDPPFADMQNLEGTNLWYLQRRFELDDLLDYLVVVDDPMTPLRTERNLVERINKYWKPDELNPKRIRSGQTQTSVLQMPSARPFPNWETMSNVPRGTVREHDFSSVQMGFTNRQVWVYTPPDYHDNRNHDYPLLILLDGQWMVGPLQVPFIADTLIKHQQMEPTIIVMLQSGSQSARLNESVSNDKHYAAILLELLPLMQGEYRIDATNLGIGGAGLGQLRRLMRR
ncbi:MAG: alpha/beta hydrolase-fold protein [Anaerolineae bacterium]|nr:alpha/beta hydrolase-fold protein [Anaerolineae bacterium]